MANILTRISSRLEPHISLQQRSLAPVRRFPLRFADPAPSLHFINISDAAKEALSCADSSESGAGPPRGRRLPPMGVGHTFLTRLHVVLAIGVDSLVTACTLAQGLSSGYRH